MLHKDSSEELIQATMRIELERLERFVKSLARSAEEILETGLIDEFVLEASYFRPPLSQPKIKLRPPTTFYRKLAPKKLLQRPGFSDSLIVPGFGYSAGLEIEVTMVNSYAPGVPPVVDVQFEVNHVETIRLFEWIFNEWRRPLCQLIRGLPNVQLWGNGLTLDGPKGSHTKDPGILLDHHLGRHYERPEDRLVSLRSEFAADDVDRDIVLTFGVFLALFDAVYRLTDARANPDRLMRHYERLIQHLPKSPFRKASILDASL